jgi:hypothetical protein
VMSHGGDFAALKQTAAALFNHNDNYVETESNVISCAPSSRLTAQTSSITANRHEFAKPATIGPHVVGIFHLGRDLQQYPDRRMV